MKKTWHTKVVHALYLVDLIAIAFSVVSAHIFRFGFEQVDLFLQFNGSRSVRVLGFGTEEYRLVTRGTTYCFCMIIIVAFFLKVEFTRLYMLISYPLGIISLAFMRWLLRAGTSAVA